QVFVVFRIEFIQVLLDGAHLRLGLGNAHFRFESRDTGDLVSRAIVQHLGGALSHRNVNIGLAIKEKPGWSNADNSVVSAIQRHRLAYNVRTAIEAALPQPITDDGRWHPSRTVFILRKLAALLQFYS